MSQKRTGNWTVISQDGLSFQKAINRIYFYTNEKEAHE